MNIGAQTLTEDSISAVHHLEGRILKTGWKVVEKVKAKPGSSGSHFSVCYLVEKEGQTGFLKAINVLAFLQSEEDVLVAMTNMLHTYNFEKELLKRCADTNLSRVSRLLEASFENFSNYIVKNVYYMIFERADGDVRNHINFSNSIDVAWKLRSLHHIATGTKQLHGVSISHQDLKPSNVFIFNSIVSKIGDLGRSLCQALESPHSSMDFSGDNRYAPPEVFHKFVIPEWQDKVFAIDCYLLGSMAAYYFTGQSMTSLLSKNLDRNINILSYSFESALPYWIEAFERVLIIIQNHSTEVPDQSKFVEAVRMLCYPDPRRRGHVKNVSQCGSNYRLERFVELFNLLARKAEIKIGKKEIL